MIINFKNIQKQIINNDRYEELFKFVVDTINQDLNCVDYKIIEEFTRGTSAGIKRSVSFGKVMLFIKIGEKVARENDIYSSQFFRNNKIFLNRVEKYCFHPDVLVLPFYEGENLDELLFNNSISLSDKIEKIQSILNTSLDSFWLQNIHRGHDNLNWVENYVTSRLDKLKADIDSITIENKVIPIEDFLNLPITYSMRGKKYELSSIETMIENVILLFHNYKPQLTSCITVDFQPPNIIIGKDGFKHIDLSNGEIDGDIALDIGKFFNFINRFYRISFLRDEIKLGDTIKPSYKVDRHGISLKIEGENQNNLSNVVSHIEGNFSLKAASLIGDFHLIDRVKLYKFVINAITIRRHLNYSQLQDLLFVNLVDSYAEIFDKIINI